jgi:hypothetical protein
MVNVVRAPAWGSKIARIITHDALMEITGDGDAAFLITDNQTCDTIRRAARETVIGPKNARNEPEYFGHAKICGEKRVEAFKKYFQSIETRFSPKGADEETEG